MKPVSGGRDGASTTRFKSGTLNCLALKYFCYQVIISHIINRPRFIFKIKKAETSVSAYSIDLSGLTAGPSSTSPVGPNREP